MKTRRSTCVGRKWRLVIALAWLANARAASGAVSAADERPVALPPFIVEEATKGPPWRYAEVPGYEVLSRCSDAVTRRVVETHYQLHQLLGEILPVQLQVTMSVPRALILYDEELQPAASREVIARMMRSDASALPREDAPMTARGGLRIPASVPRYSFLPNLRLWDRDGMAVFMIVRRDDFEAERLALTHDYVTFLVKSRVPALPPWFVQGFLSLYRQITFGGGRLTLEPLQWISEHHTEAVKKGLSSAPPLLPLDDLLSLKLGPPNALATYDPVQAWQAMAAFFVRWGLDADDGAHRAALWKFAERSAMEGTSEALFAACFGFSYAEAQGKLAAYRPHAVRRAVHFRPAKLTKLGPMPLRNASDGQIARLKGDWERLEVPFVKSMSPELAPKYLEQARRTLKRGYERDERDPRLLAVIGLCEVDAGDDAAARGYLEAAVAIGPIRPRAQYELARLRFAGHCTSPAGSNDALSVAQTADVLQPLFDARAALPPLPEVYELIADVWARSAATPTRGHLAVLNEGVRLFPRRAPLVLRSAELNLRHGYREEAAALIDIGIRIAVTDASREPFVALQQQLATQVRP